MTKPSVVYFVRGQKTKLIKIGFSTNLDARLSSVSSDTKQDISVLKTIPGGYAEEQAFHLQFTAHRTSAKGEWFKDEGALKTFLRARSSQYRKTENPDPLLLPRGLIVGFATKPELAKDLERLGVERVWQRGCMAEDIEDAVSYLRGRPGTLIVNEDLRCLGNTRKEIFNYVETLQKAGVNIFDVSVPYATPLKLIERALIAQSSASNRGCHKTIQRRGRKGGTAKGEAAASRRNALIADDIAGRLCHHPKLTWNDRLEILGEFFSMATIKRIYA